MGLIKTCILSKCTFRSFKWPVFVCILFCILFQGASAAEYAPGTVEIINTNGIPRYSIIDGDRIVWTEYKVVMLHTISENETIKISNGNYFELYPPKISGDHIIWIEKDESASYPGTWDLFLYTISTGELEVISTEKNAPRDIGISGKNIVWEESNKIYLYDIDEQNYRKISGRILYIGSCTIDGDIVAWEGTGNPSSLTNDLYLYNITEKNTEIVSDLPGFRDGFYLNEGKVIWGDSRTVHSKSVIRVYDTGSRDLSEITTVEDYAGGFSLSGDLFAYTNFGFWSTDTPDSRIHLVNLTTGEDMILTPAENGFRVASISGNNMVWPEGEIVLFTYDPSGEPLNRNSRFSDLGSSKGIPGFTWILAFISIGIVLLYGKIHR